jgi:hypothetical protein
VLPRAVVPRAECGEPDPRAIQGIQKRGLFRALLSDNGSEMLAGETREGLARLGISHDTTLRACPEQNGKQGVVGLGRGPTARDARERPEPDARRAQPRDAGAGRSGTRSR